jgi:hypothetical protein
MGRLAPTPEMLADVDAILVDLLHAGARYYTWRNHGARREPRPGGKLVVVPTGRIIGGAVRERADTAFLDDWSLRNRRGAA